MKRLFTSTSKVTQSKKDVEAPGTNSSRKQLPTLPLNGQR